jgi:hypothetical protein
MSVLTDLKNRGVGDVFFVVCYGLIGRTIGPRRVHSADGPCVSHSSVCQAVAAARQPQAKASESLIFRSRNGGMSARPLVTAGGVLLVRRLGLC